MIRRFSNGDSQIYFSNVAVDYNGHAANWVKDALNASYL